MPGKRDAIPNAEAGGGDDREDHRASISASHPAKYLTKKSCSDWCTRWSTKAHGILEEGIASKASDIDMVYLMGYGFPACTAAAPCSMQTR